MDRYRGKYANTCGPGTRDSGFLCRSLRDLTTNIQTSLMISDCIQHRTLGALMTLEPGVSLHRLLRYGTAIKKQSCLMHVTLRKHFFRELHLIWRDFLCRTHGSIESHMCAYSACDRAPVLVYSCRAHQDDFNRLRTFCYARDSFVRTGSARISVTACHWETGRNRFAKLLIAHSSRPPNLLL